MCVAVLFIVLLFVIMPIEIEIFYSHNILSLYSNIIPMQVQNIDRPSYMTVYNNTVKD